MLQAAAAQAQNERANKRSSPAASLQQAGWEGLVPPIPGNQARLRTLGGGAPMLRPSRNAILQRKCACGGAATGASGKCDECKEKEQVFQRRPLAVNTPGDRFEQEADRAADLVVSGRDAAAVTLSAVHDGSVGMSDETSPQAAPSVVSDVIASPGRALDGQTLSLMAAGLGRDFTNVRVHTDAAAAQSASSVHARAYTIGEHLVFGAGEFAPASHEGRRLIAHELAHTLQQGGGARATPHSLLQRDGDGKGSGEAKDKGEVKDEAKDKGEGEQEEETKTPARAIDKPIQTIMIDPGSGRTRFFSAGGETIDGTVTELTKSFPAGDYYLEVDTSKDKQRMWNIFNPDGSKYLGGLQFDVELEGVDFSKLKYAAKTALKVGSGVLPALIDIEARITAIKTKAAAALVGDDDEKAIIELLANVPPEQAAAFVARLREEKVGDASLIDRLDSVVDGENNISLHKALSRLKIQGGGDKAGAALANAPELAWHDVMGFFEQASTFAIERTPGGKIRIRYLGGISGGLYSHPEFQEIKDMSRKERLAIMTGGIEVDPDQPIIVHDYDSDKSVVLTAEDLIAYQHAGVRKFMEDVGTVASLATPAGGETAAAKVLSYGTQIAAAAVLLIDENKLNIKEWFPNWGPAIIAATEKVKLALAVVNIAQLLHGGWSLFTKLRQVRAARAAMDAKAVVSTAEELALAEKQAVQLEGQADQILSNADKARQELGIADTAVGASGKVEEAGQAAAAVVTSPAEKTRIIEAAINEKKFGGDFAALANRELSANSPNMRPSKIAGYTVEVPIEGTEHFLARKPDGAWCLFSGTANGCGVIAVAQDVDQLFAELGKELGTGGAAKIGTNAKADIASAVADAKAGGLVGPAGEPVGVDLVVQPHEAASDTRKALGVSGSDVQSAHNVPTAAVKNVPGYSRKGALTVLLPRATHKAFDDFWKNWSIAQQKAGISQVTVDKFIGIMDQAIEQTPNLPDKAKRAMQGRLFDEFYKELGLKPDDMIDLPYKNFAP